MGKRKRPERSVEDVLAPLLRRSRRDELQALGVLFLIVGTAVAVGFWSHQPLAFIAALVFLVVGAMAMAGIHNRAQLARARALIDAEHHEPAIALLKELLDSGVADEAAYTIAQAYDKQGAHRLALASLERYLEQHADGVWAIEAKVRVEELRAVAAPAIKAREVAVQASCPFCKSDLLPDTPVVECAACGTSHHAGCYEEQGGCAVYGCESKSAKARVKA